MASASTQALNGHWVKSCFAHLWCASSLLGGQPIMLLVLPVKVRSRELAVCPRSDIRHLCGGDSGGESSNVNVLVGEGLAIPPGRNRK